MAAAGAGLVLPAGAKAAQLQELKDQCFKAGETVTIRGDGFTANAPVTVQVSGGETTQTTAGPTGAIAVDVQAPRFTTPPVAPRSFTVTASYGLDPGNVADAISLFVTRSRPASNAPVEGDPNAVTTWQFANFKPGRWIYGHFRFKGTTQRTVRFGRAGAAPCGQLSVRARRVPVPRLHAGSWRLQIDQRKAYSIKTKPRYVVEFSLMRSPRLGG